MAQKMPAEDNVGDLTRESLIAISYSLPDSDKVAASPADQSPASPADQSPEKTTEGGNTVREKDVSSIEDYISGLISLSYTSPDAETLPEFEG